MDALLALSEGANRSLIALAYVYDDGRPGHAWSRYRSVHLDARRRRLRPLEVPKVRFAR